MCQALTHVIGVPGSQCDHALFFIIVLRFAKDVFFHLEFQLVLADHDREKGPGELEDLQHQLCNVVFIFPASCDIFVLLSLLIFAFSIDEEGLRVN